jgi:recombination protein RecA
LEIRSANERISTPRIATYFGFNAEREIYFIMTKKTEKAPEDIVKVEGEKASESRDDMHHVNKENKTSFTIFDENPFSNVKYIDSGYKELNVVLSGSEDGGYPRGRLVELFGPEGSGKTFLLAKLYAACAKNGLKVAHYDAEGTFAKEFAKMHGVDVTALHYTTEDKAETVFEQIESLCQNNVYDVIGIDSLASLVPENTIVAEMGKQTYSPLAGTISRCIPRLSSALKSSKTVLILVNQLRENVGGFGYGPTDHTPGGKAVKYYASLRIDVRKASYMKSDRPDLYDANNKPIGHVLRVKCEKNKVTNPFRQCEIDLRYKLQRPIIEIIKDGIENDVIERQRSSKTGELRGKKLTFGGSTFTPDSKDDYEAVFTWLKDVDLICDFLAKVERDDFETFVASGDLTEEEVQAYILKADVQDASADPEKEI